MLLYDIRDIESILWTFIIHEEIEGIDEEQEHWCDVLRQEWENQWGMIWEDMMIIVLYLC